MTGRGASRTASSNLDKSYDGSKQLALDPYVEMCQARANRRSTGFFQAIGDFLGFDGGFGYDGATYGPLAWDNIGRAISGDGPEPRPMYLPFNDEEIVIYGPELAVEITPSGHVESPWLRGLLSMRQPQPSAYERNYPEGMAPQWTAGPTYFDLAQQRQTQLGMAYVANSLNGSGAVASIANRMLGGSLEEQVAWGRGFAALEMTAGGMIGTPVLNRGRYTPAGPTIEYEAAPYGGRANASPYGELRPELRGTGLQANHINQDAAFRSVIPGEEGLAVGMRGNAFRDVGSPHYQFHAELEAFWSQYRRGGQFYGEVPTNAQYGAAAERALIRSGYSTDAAVSLSQQAAAQRLEYGLPPWAPVPRVPGRMGQTGGN
jgi:hypothetical protein